MRFLRHFAAAAERRTPNGERFLYPNLPASRPQEDG
jgi:hypothetical protein